MAVGHGSVAQRIKSGIAQAYELLGLHRANPAIQRQLANIVDPDCSHDSLLNYCDQYLGDTVLFIEPVGAQQETRK